MYVGVTEKQNIRNNGATFKSKQLLRCTRRSQSGGQKQAKGLSQSTEDDVVTRFSNEEIPVGGGGEPSEIICDALHGERCMIHSLRWQKQPTYPVF